ncbi:TetR/AcrR family transcriptional regulator [Actinomadura harenae]|uniref:TetR/AcrR family transcriptional regulator n=1 Tax=Actinomadura harenae TaxID=2483351 RepID=A0A3M2KZ44_9ACTN|nr:TetR/AcrR family transcriptional regulator [Actinomadura harenae]RMI30759.1 TetR/AcrR family transcriptional regulator [Actinomadura harenae]
MTTEYTGAGDPRRSLELLWGVRERPRRGPRPKLTPGQIVGRAVEIADADGLEAVSIRRIADDLGVSPMSIYTYVPGKAELLDAMLDRALGEVVPPGGEVTGWRARVAHIARENWRIYHAHPWLLQVATARPPLGPNLLGKYEHELLTVEGLGLTDLEMDAAIALINGLAETTARTSVNRARAERRTGLTDREWWEATAPFLAEHVDASRYPVSSRVGTASSETYDAAVGPEHAFEFGLARILDGIETLITARRAGDSPAG